MYPSFRFALLLFVVIVPLTLSAQTNFPLTPMENKALFSFQFQHPFVKRTNTNFTLVSGTYDLTFVAPVSRTMSIVGTLPYAGYSATSQVVTETSGAISNISIGVTKVSKSGSSTLNLKIFLPTAPSVGIKSGAMMYGFYHRFYDLEQYLPEALSLQVQYFFKKKFNELLIGGVIGGTGLIWTDRRFDELEILARYGVSMGYENKDMRIVAEFIGIGILTRMRRISNNNFEHFIALSGQWTSGSFMKPKVNIHFPLRKKLASRYDSSLTLGCDFVLP